MVENEQNKLKYRPAGYAALFVRFCLQNNGRLSGGKRASHFDFLLDEEIASLELAVQSAYGSETLNNG